MPTEQNVNITPGSGAGVDTVNVGTGAVGTGSEALRQVFVVGDPNTKTNVGNVTATGGQQVEGAAVDNTVAQGNPVLVAGSDNIGLLRAVLVDSSGALMILHRFEVFGDILAELRRIRLGISMLVGEELDDPGEGAE